MLDCTFIHQISSHLHEWFYGLDNINMRHCEYFKNIFRILLACRLCFISLYPPLPKKALRYRTFFKCYNMLELLHYFDMVMKLFLVYLIYKYVWISIKLQNINCALNIWHLHQNMFLNLFMSFYILRIINKPF